MRPGSQILRDYNPPSTTAESRHNSLPSTPPKLSGKDELRLQAISNSRSQDPSSWTIDFGSGGGGTGTLPRKRRPRERNTMRPRSADPSPNRGHTTAAPVLTKQRETAQSPAPKKTATPTSAKRNASFSSPSRSRAATPPVKKPQKRASTPPVSRSTGGTASKKPPPASPKRKSPVTPRSGGSKPTTPQPKTPKTRTHSSSGAAKSGTPQPLNSQSTVSCPPDSSSPAHQSSEVTPTSSPGADPHIDLKSLNEGTLRHLMGSPEGEGKEEGEETYTVAPPSSSGDDEESLSSFSEPTVSSRGQRGVVPVRESGLGGAGEREVGVTSPGGGKSPPSSRRQWAHEEVRCVRSFWGASCKRECPLFLSTSAKS